MGAGEGQSAGAPCSVLSCLFLCLFVLGSIGFGLRVLCLVDSALPLEPCPSPFCFSYFSGRVWHFGKRSQAYATMPGLFVEIGSCQLFA
jgi:hypothetical protein